MSKCIYCNKQIKTTYTITAGKHKELVYCCSDDCVKRTQTSLQFFDRSRPFLGVGIFISIIFILVSAVFLTISKIWIGSLFMGIGFALLGFTILILPLATSQTFLMFGIKKTLFITRLVGLCIIIISPFLVLFLLS